MASSSPYLAEAIRSMSQPAPSLGAALSPGMQVLNQWAQQRAQQRRLPSAQPGAPGAAPTGFLGLPSAFQGWVGQDPPY